VRGGVLLEDMKKYLASNRTVSFFAIILSVFFVVTTVQAATTISTNIQTDGTLSVTGASTLANASTTLFSATGPAYFGATATSSFDTAGNLGIWTTTPTSALTLVGNVNGSATIEIHNPYAAGIDLYTHAAGNQTYRAPTITLNKSRGTQSAPTAVQANDLLGYLQYLGYGATQYVEGSVIESVAAENWTDTAAGTDLDFYTNDTGSNSLHLDMELQHNGTINIGRELNGSAVLPNTLNVANTPSMGGIAVGYDYGRGASAPISGLIVEGATGIGTSTPIANFQVANGSNATTTMELGSTGQNKGSCLKMYRTDGSAIYAYVAAGATTFTLSTTACATVSNF
jgi:hypothetical protein